MKLSAVFENIPGRIRPGKRTLRVLLVVILVLPLAATTAIAQIGPGWETWGPAPIGGVEYTGRIAAAVCSPTDPDRYFVGGADSGVWRTTDGGASWTALTDDLPTTAIGALAIDPTDENVIYAGTGEANFAYHSRFGRGVFKSTDGGENWTALAESTFAGRCISRVVVDPIDPLVVYAAVTPAGGFLPAGSAAKGHPQANDPVGVFKSSDGGVNWTQLTTGLPSKATTDLAMQPDDSQVLYAAVGHIFGDLANGIYKTTDGGQVWTKLAGGLPTTDVGRISIAVAPSMPQRLYASITQVATATGGSAELRGLWRSDNGGATWIQRSITNYMASYGWYLNVVSVHPTAPDTVIVGGLTLHRSINGGSSWTDITPPHVDLHALAWDASGRLLAGDDGGLHRTANLGNSWTPLNDGLGLIQFYAGLSLDPLSGDIAYGGTQDNGTNKRTGPNSWIHVFGGDGGFTAVNPTNPNIVFCEYQGTGNLYRSTNGGGSFNFSGSGISTGDRNCFLPPFEIDPNDPQRMIYGTHRVYLSTSGGVNWAPISDDLTATPTGAIHSLAIAPSDSQTFWVTTNDGNVQVSFHGGLRWVLVRQGLPGWFRVMRQVFVAPDDDHTAYLAGSAFGTDQVLRTTDGGDTWAVLDGDLPDLPVNVIAVDPRPTIDVIYLGTEAGVYRSLNDGTNWHRYGQGLPNAAIIDLRLDLVRSRLIAAAQGRGAWRIDAWLSGDINGDGSANGGDISSFADVLLGLSTDPDAILRSDLNADGTTGSPDIPLFVDTLAG